MNGVRRAALAVATAILLLAQPVSAWAYTYTSGAPYGDNSIYDNTPQRTRLLVDPTYPTRTIYLSVPFYVPLPAGAAHLTSVSTPSYYNGVIYQYASDGTNHGYLFALDKPSISASAFLSQHPLYNLPAYAVARAQEAHAPLKFTTPTAWDAGGQDMLTTQQGWQSIAVGTSLYSWSYGTWPSQSALAQIGAHIIGNPGNTNYQVDMSPLIVPPTPVQVFDTLDSRIQTVSVPMAVAGSWDGGVTAEPLGLPSYDILLNYSKYLFTTTHEYPGDTAGVVTSDPAWVGNCPGVGADCVAFGVASWYRPRVIEWSLATGRYRAIGVGEIGGAIADAVTINNVGSLASAPRIIVHDVFGTEYQFGLNGQLLYVGNYTTGPVEMGKDQSVQYAPQWSQIPTVWEVGHGGTDLVLCPPSSRYAVVQYGGYSGLTSPTSWIGAGGVSYTAFSYLSATSFGRRTGPGISIFGGNAGSAYVSQRGLTNYQEISSPVASYVGVEPDVTSAHWLMTWTNISPVGPAIELFVPATYSVRASAPATVPSGGTATISARPIPSGVTFDRISPEPCSIGASPVTVRLSSSLGDSGYLSLTRSQAPTPANPWSTWSVSYRLPANGTGKPVTWRGTVSATDKFCSVATSAVSVVEEPGASVVPPSGGPGLRLSPNPAMWSQTISATLTPTAPSLPSGETLVRWQITSATLRYPAKNPNWGVTLPYYPISLGATAQMALNGHSANVKVQEGWWDGGCQDPANIPVCLTNQLLRNNATGAGSLYPNDTTIPALKSAVTATYRLTVTDSRQVRTCTTKIDPATGQPVIDPSTGKPEQVCTVKTITSTFTTGPQTASASLTVDGDAKDVVGGG